MASNSNSTEQSGDASPVPSGSEAYEVRRIGIKEHLPAAESLAEAFKKDPVTGYIIGVDNMDEQGLTGDAYKLSHDILKYITAAVCYKGIVTTIGPNYDAVALWLPPGTHVDGVITYFRSGLWRLPYQLSKEGNKRTHDEFFPLLHDTKKIVLGKRAKQCYYLVYLGTRPGSERKGYGRKLLDHGIAMADAEGAPCYLESSAARNIPFYEKAGFKLVKDIFLNRADAPLPLNVMMREPKTTPGGEKPLSKSSSQSSSVKCEKAT